MNTSNLARALRYQVSDIPAMLILAYMDNEETALALDDEKLPQVFRDALEGELYDMQTCWGDFDEMYVNGKLHSLLDEPAFVNHSHASSFGIPGLPGSYTGRQYWFRHGKQHRGEDEAAVIGWGGFKQWWDDGKLHRDGDKPAVVRRDGTQEWYKDGKLHRDGDEPAVIYPSGDSAWYIHGVIQHTDNEVERKWASFNRRQRMGKRENVA